MNYPKNTQCKNCNELIGNNTKYNLCLPCFNKIVKKKFKNKYCIDCSKEIGRYSKRCYSCASKYRIATTHPQKGEHNSNYKHGLTDNGKCKDCGNPISNWSALQGDGRCSKCNYKFYTGIRHHNYIKGEGNKPYPLEFNDKLKSKIKERDDYICQKCYITEEQHITIYGIKLSIHHIDYNKENCKEENLITLCNECNLRINFNRKYWTEYFRSIIKCYSKR